MSTIDLTLKGSPLSLSIQRKDAAEAEALYKKILQAMGATSPQVVELTCDRESDKKIAVLSSEIAAMQLSEKSGAAASGKVGGFLGLS